MALGSLTPFRRGSLARGDQFGTGSLFDLHRQMDRLFDDLLNQGPPAQGLGGRAGFPALEVSQHDDHIEICAELPGVKEEDIDLSIEDGVLTLCGEKKSSRKDEESGYSERSYGRFERKISLPSNIDEDKCSAEFRDGVLTVSIPKSEEKTRGRRIPLGGRARSEDRPEDQLIEQTGQSGSSQKDKEKSGEKA